MYMFLKSPQVIYKEKYRTVTHAAIDITWMDPHYGRMVCTDIVQLIYIVGIWSV
jgi:hypothetical protein